MNNEKFMQRVNDLHENINKFFASKNCKMEMDSNVTALFA